MRFTKEELKDYVLNNDFEVQIAKMDCKAIARALESEGIKANHADIVSVVLDAQSDPYIQVFTKGKKQYA